jgi:hypothetical protein
MWGSIFKKKKRHACKWKGSVNSGPSDMGGDRKESWGSNYISYILENVIMKLLLCTINIKTHKIMESCVWGEH